MTEKHYFKINAVQMRGHCNFRATEFALFVKICTIKFATTKDAYYANLKQLPKPNAQYQQLKLIFPFKIMCKCYKDRIKIEHYRK